MSKILVFGSSGQVGHSLQLISKTSPHHFQFLTRSDLDLTNLALIKKRIDDYAPEYIVNCAAYTQVDLAEENIETCYTMNRDAVQVMAKASAQNNAVFIHLSSDYVYHPDHNDILTEESEAIPQGVYAKSKLEGDRLALDNNPKTIIIRTSWVYASTGKNFVRTMARLTATKKSLKVVSDQIGSPTYAPDIADVIIKTIDLTTEKVFRSQDYGIYHYTNEGFCSWYDFATAINDILSNHCEINPCTTEEYPTPAKRPLNSRLSKQKIIGNFDIELIPWKVSLQKCLYELQQGF